MLWPALPRIVAAVTVIVAYVALCALLEWRARRRDTMRHARAAPAQEATLVAYASQTGYAEEVAVDTVRRLRAGGIDAHAAPLAVLARAALPHRAPLLLVASTTGEGDPPDAAADFAATVMTGERSLVGVRYGLLALGDRAYARFCGFGRALDAWLLRSGAQPLFPMVEVDAGDPTALVRWHRQVAGVAGLDPDLSDRAHRWAAVVLAARVQLNAGSPGGAVHHLRFDVPSDLAWDAGDIAVVAMATAVGEVTREYSIASRREEGTLDILVREVRGADGALGVGTGHLLRDTAAGGAVRLRVRRNRAFHAPTADVPLVLVGNGTGIAGLRALLAQRIAQGRRGNWLLFGERTRVHDLHFGDDLARWQRQGGVARLDLAFSRDAGGPRYVQDALLAAADELHRWIEAGAAVYVCGSEKGMAPGVDAALRSILGDDAVVALRREGRYRRDVY